MEDIGELLADLSWSLGQPEAYIWWAAAMLVGLIAFPLTFAFFHRLPDRGYAFTKVIGLLLLSYCLWIGATLGIFPNSRGSIILILILLALPSAALAGRYRQELTAFLRDGWPYLLLVEVFFFFTFALAVSLRSFAPEIQWGEKPFELAFVNAINRSEFLPADDPWLSGHSISYYHFGYLMASTLTKLTGLGANVTFYLSLSLVATLAASTVFGVVYNLLASARTTTEKALAAAPSLMPRAVIFGLVGAGLLLLVSNLEGVFEMLAAHGIGSSTFYDRVGIFNLTGPESSGEWYPTKFWWWWRATRIGSDWDIQEFPFFSFHFGDLHPHVFALPFTITAVAIAFQLFRSGDGLDSLWIVRHPWRFLFTALAIGALGFMNLWDLPTFFFLVVVVALVANWRREGSLNLRAVWDTASFAATLAIAAVLLYLPFYLTFESSAEGPALVETATVPDYAPINSLVTRPGHFLMVWLPLLWLGLSLIVARILVRPWPRLRPSMAVLSVLPWLAPLGIWAFLILVTRGPGGFADELTTRGPSWGTLIMLAASLTAAGFALARDLFREHANEDARRSYLFALMLVGLGLLLILGPELYWIQDMFDFRINTVFKLYYQAWMLLSIGGAVGLYYLAVHWHPTRPVVALGRLCWVSLTVIIIAASLVYTVAATFDRTSGFTNAQRMDGLVHVQVHHPDEYEAIRWLNDNVSGTPIILEAVGGAYSDYARISSRTGLPTVIGWPGHERIWRGSDEPINGRQEDVALTYTTTSPREAKAILEKYDVEYVYVGHLEEEAYGAAGLAKFAAFMEVAFRNESVTIYRMPREVQTVVSAH
jgi:YYY domain-containing protein